MTNILPIIFILFLVLTRGICAQWDFAVTTKNKIRFFDERWIEIKSSAHRFDEISALTYDEFDDVIYFSDEKDSNSSIFSLKQIGGNDFIKHVVQRTMHEKIAAIAYDPLERKLYWTDTVNQRINYANIDQNDNDIGPKILLDLKAEKAIPYGLAIDICRRKLYWTNSNHRKSNIESIDLNNNNERQVIITENLYFTHGIVVDQTEDRLFWVVDQEGDSYSVDCSNLDGSYHKTIVSDFHSVPMHLVVTKDTIYWTDLTNSAVWGHEKEFLKLPSPIANETVVDVMLESDIDADINELNKPYKLLHFDEEPYGIVARINFSNKLQQLNHCAAVINKIKNRVEDPNVNKTMSYCLNGDENPKSSNAMCFCHRGWEGARCEKSVCQNYCIHGGKCSMTDRGKPICHCPSGFDGERCQKHICADYCLNDGICRINGINNAPECDCRHNFGGIRCEHNATLFCALTCRLLKYEPETNMTFGCTDICTELSAIDSFDNYVIAKKNPLLVCKNTYGNATIIMVLTGGVVLSLTLIFFIVMVLRRVYKPARPRIKKTFVVRKETPRMSPDTPLTNRPAMATEQCEITIENCCNMNICETPCFDPKLVQQSLSPGDSHLKEDHKMLIHNMEDDLY